MPIFFCPHCNKRITVAFDCTDFVHDCSQNPTTPKSIANEDVVVIGNWEDYSGTGSITGQEVLRQGMVNELWGQRAGVQGKDKERLTKRGVRASTRRQRPHLEFISNIKQN